MRRAPAASPRSTVLPIRSSRGSWRITSPERNSAIHSAFSLLYMFFMDLIVTSTPNGAWLDWGAGQRRAAIGPAGIAVKGGEGDGITPRGRFAIREIFYRADRLPAPLTSLPLRVIENNDGWCDAPDDPNYNRHVKLPYPASAENMWRDDHLYDLVAVLGYNDAPVVAGKGSAIFLHVARPDYSPTQGCVALACQDLLAALAQLQPGDQVEIV
ncbi:MAG TPA: L,D-transpeptidase family protein [Rhizomicrobium sp.]|nr:L,D-transpeptidase family protein [Rhizomicrobium sp.]